MKRLYIIIACLVLLAVPLAANAQSIPDVPGDNQPTVVDPIAPPAAPAGCTALTPEEAGAYVTLLGGTPGNAVVLAVYICTGFATYFIGDTNTFWDRSCEEVSVYKVSNQGTQDLWQTDNRVCGANGLSIIAEGTGHYIVYGYGSAAEVDTTPLVISPLLSVGNV